MHLLAVVPFFLKPGYSIPAYHGVCMVWYVYDRLARWIIVLVAQSSNIMDLEVTGLSESCLYYFLYAFGLNLNLFVKVCVTHPC